MKKVNRISFHCDMRQERLQYSNKSKQFKKKSCMTVCNKIVYQTFVNDNLRKKRD